MPKWTHVWTGTFYTQVIGAHLSPARLWHKRGLGIHLHRHTWVTDTYNQNNDYTMRWIKLVHYFRQRDKFNVISSWVSQRISSTFHAHKFTENKMDTQYYYLAFTNMSRIKKFGSTIDDYWIYKNIFDVLKVETRQNEDNWVLSRSTHP
jgi:hypothetical protein